MTLTHFAPNQASAIMQRHNRLDPGIKQSESRKPHQTLKPLWDLARLFGKRTTIHGLNRLLGETEGHYERIVWLLTVLSAFIGSIYVCLILSNRFNEGKFQTVVDSTRMPVYKISFPTISICNLNRLNWGRIDEAKKMFLPNETSTEKLKLFELILGAYDDISFANFERFSVLEGQPVEALNHINFSLVVNFMTWRCEEFLQNCEWRHKKMNCCEIFSRRRTKMGPCWSFNTLETEEGRRMKRSDPMYPWRTGGAGPESGLNVRLLINGDKHYPKSVSIKGIYVMVTEPLVWHRDPFRISEKTESMVEIDPVIFFYDNGTRSLTSDQRQCVFENEPTSSNFKSLLNYVYMIENCQAQCHQEYLYQYCNCSVDILFPPGQYPPCKAKDLVCLSRNNAHFLHSHEPGEEQYVLNEPKGMVCQCFRNCYSLNYISDARSSFLPVDFRKNVSYVDLDAHFRFDSLMVYRTSMVFGWVDLMVAFGGIAGLFLGCSLISAIELAYFAFVDMPNFFIKRVQNDRRTQLTQSQYTTASHGLRGSHQKFGSIMQRNLACNGNQLEEFVMKNNLINIISKDDHYNSLQPGQLITFDRLKVKPSRKENVFYK